MNLAISPILFGFEPVKFALISLIRPDIEKFEYLIGFYWTELASKKFPVSKFNYIIFNSFLSYAGSWYTPMDKELPLTERERRQHRIRYYQWVRVFFFRYFSYHINNNVRILNCSKGAIFAAFSSHVMLHTAHHMAQFKCKKWS